MEKLRETSTKLLDLINTSWEEKVGLNWFKMCNGCICQTGWCQYFLSGSKNGSKKLNKPVSNSFEYKTPWLIPVEKGLTGLRW